MDLDNSERHDEMDFSSISGLNEIDFQVATAPEVDKSDKACQIPEETVMKVMQPYKNAAKEISEMRSLKSCLQ